MATGLHRAQVLAPLPMLLPTPHLVLEQSIMPWLQKDLKKINDSILEITVVLVAMQEVSHMHKFCKMVVINSGLL